MNDIPKLWKWRQLRRKKIFGQVHLFCASGRVCITIRNDLRKIHNPLKFNSKLFLSRLLLPKYNANVNLLLSTVSRKQFNLCSDLN